MRFVLVEKKRNNINENKNLSEKSEGKKTSRRGVLDIQLKHIQYVSFDTSL